MKGRSEGKEGIETDLDQEFQGRENEREKKGIRGRGKLKGR